MVGILKKTLIAYGTRYGATPEVCAVIAKILEREYKLKVEIWNLKEHRARPNLSDFDNVIISSGIEYGLWVPSAEEYLKNDFSGKKVAIFISSGYAGEEELYDTAYKTFLKEVLARYQNINPVAIAAFGGKVPQELLPKLANERVLGRLPEFQEDNRDWSKIEQWAHLVGKIFSE